MKLKKLYYKTKSLDELQKAYHKAVLLIDKWIFVHPEFSYIISLDPKKFILNVEICKELQP